MNRVRKAVFPVAGMGTRFLPATKALAKEMLPVIDKPLIQYAVEEAVAAGIDHLVFVTGHTKKAIEDHFDRSAELEAMLEAQGKTELLARVRAILPGYVTCMYIRQPAPLGLGHAVLCARPAIGDEPFAILLPDDLIDSDGPGCTEQMVRRFESTGHGLVAVQTVPRGETGRYGIVRLGRTGRPRGADRGHRGETGSGQGSLDAGCGGALHHVAETVRRTGSHPAGRRRRDSAYRRDRGIARAGDDQRISVRRNPIRLRIEGRIPGRECRPCAETP